MTPKLFLLNLFHPPLVVLAILLTTSIPGLAEYIWLDENGHKQYSDQAPPASIPKSRILKFDEKAPDTQSPISSTPAPNGKIAPSESVADKEMAYKKRHDELVAKQKKEADAAQANAAKSENCKHMQEYKQELDSGQRIHQTDGYMTDEQRAQAQAEITQRMSSECN